MRHFEEAMKKIRPLSTQELNMYKRMAEQFGKPELPAVAGGAGGVGSKPLGGTAGTGTTGTEDPGISLPTNFLIEFRGCSIVSVVYSFYDYSPSITR